MQQKLKCIHFNLTHPTLNYWLYTVCWQRRSRTAFWKLFCSWLVATLRTLPTKLRPLWTGRRVQQVDHFPDAHCVCVCVCVCVFPCNMHFFWWNVLQVHLLRPYSWRGGYQWTSWNLSHLWYQFLYGGFEGWGPFQNHHNNSTGWEQSRKIPALYCPGTI